MGKYPVISLTLKQVKGRNYEDAKEQMWSMIKKEAIRFDYLQDSTRLLNRDKQTMMNLSMGIGNLLGVLRICENWEVESNHENGYGYSDLTLVNDDMAEIKYANGKSNEALIHAAQEALTQIEKRRYDMTFIDDGYTDIKKYGIAFYEEDCCVLMKEKTL